VRRLFFIGAPTKSEISPQIIGAITLLASRDISKELKFTPLNDEAQTG
jgi:hypothetical protein